MGKRTLWTGILLLAAAFALAGSASAAPTTWGARPGSRTPSSRSDDTGPALTGTIAAISRDGRTIEVRTGTATHCVDVSERPDAERRALRRDARVLIRGERVGGVLIATRLQAAPDAPSPAPPTQRLESRAGRNGGQCPRDPRGSLPARQPDRWGRYDGAVTPQPYPWASGTTPTDPWDRRDAAVRRPYPWEAGTGGKDPWDARTGAKDPWDRRDDDALQRPDAWDARTGEKDPWDRSSAAPAPQPDAWDRRGDRPEAAPQGRPAPARPQVRLIGVVHKPATALFSGGMTVWAGGADGSDWSVELPKGARILRGGESVPPYALKVGDRVCVWGEPTGDRKLRAASISVVGTY